MSDKKKTQDREAPLWSRVPLKTLQTLQNMGVDTSAMQAAPEGPSETPYTRAGLPGLRDYITPQMKNTNIVGLNVADTTRGDGNSTVVRRPNDFLTQAHEYEHALQRQGSMKDKDLGYETMKAAGAGNPDVEAAVLRKSLRAAVPYLKANYGMTDAEAFYFLNGAPLHELMATLSALEQKSNKQLTKDPYIKEKVLNTPGLREAYDAHTGLRQTRLDAKDLPPYTRQNTDKKPEDTTLDRLLKKLKGTFQ